ncbi:T9SS C-terminal target domain-containing protein [candidate division KSB1 bacterium]|nr:T9SS type A sorting domain-containing protein [candidate division KSB1 bacterium]RQW04403.1 MAG: T9SS C-terminal target domain-containing protein [candidate division KSB1 bacterium]
MYNKFNKIVLRMIFNVFFSTCLYAQMGNLHGDFANHTSGVLAGNKFRTTVYNDGTLGRKQPDDFAGEWPINSGHWYMIDGNIFLGSEVIDNTNALRHIVSTVTSIDIAASTGDKGPTGEWWTFLPLPGFYNPEVNKIATSTSPWSWPSFWPDKMDDLLDPGWVGSWNGYFGKDVINADEECYFVADDYQNREFNFYPDDNDPNRRGLGMRMTVRGFQWDYERLDDILFLHYDFENIGTYQHDKMVFGFKIGNNMGDSNLGGDGGDDMGGFDQTMNVAYQFDFDDIGAGFTPVGYFGGTLLETPGNAVDGIDNDGDGNAGSGIIIEESMFVPKTLNQGENIILIDYNTFQRQKQIMPADTLRIPFHDLVFKFWPGKIVEEIPHNLFDDNLNGLIDESNGAEVGEGPNSFVTYLNVGLKAVDYFSGAGTNNILLDESRDDGIDNDGDWNVLNDDVGQDGAAFTGDPGEGDGRPTSGEPNFDKTDVDESDMLGLTSYNLYFWMDIPHYEDELVWNNLTPGYFNALLQNSGVEIFFGSGYFGMAPAQFQRISLGLMCAISLEQFLPTVQSAHTVYSRNYVMEKRPFIPTLKAIAADNKVRLLWDDRAEYEIDPITGMDFEGYRIYRSSTLNFDNLTPIAQFDLVNDFSGYSSLPVNGKPFYLGDNTGIVHEYIDNTAVNGHDYYYAITAYDHGAPEMDIPPSECRISFDVETGTYGTNVAFCMPRDPYTSGTSQARHIAGHATGQVHLSVVDREKIKENHDYEVTFEDTLLDNTGNWRTRNFSLKDKTAGTMLFTTMPLLDGNTNTPIPYVIDGFRIDFDNPPCFMVKETESGWNDPAIYNFEFKVYRYSRTMGYPEAADYQIEFGEVGIANSVELAISTTRTLPSMPVNFRVKNLTTNTYIHFGFYERDVLAGTEGQFTAFTDRTRADEIIFLDANNVVTWQFILVQTDAETRRNPGLGDMVKIFLDKPFTSADVFNMTMPDDFVQVEQQTSQRPVTFQLSQNYPNPFNPSTTISYTLPRPAYVKLEIYNAIGQKVRTLVNDAQQAAVHKINWDTTNDYGIKLAAGLYIYQLRAESDTESFVETKKMIILK